jgi:hypothetical protein
MHRIDSQSAPPPPHGGAAPQDPGRSQVDRGNASGGAGGAERGRQDLWRGKAEIASGKFTQSYDGNIVQLRPTDSAQVRDQLAKDAGADGSPPRRSGGGGTFRWRSSLIQSPLRNRFLTMEMIMVGVLRPSVAPRRPALALASANSSGAIPARPSETTSRRRAVANVDEVRMPARGCEKLCAGWRMSLVLPDCHRGGSSSWFSPSICCTVTGRIFGHCRWWNARWA